MTLEERIMWAILYNDKFTKLARETEITQEAIEELYYRTGKVVDQIFNRNNTSKEKRSILCRNVIKQTSVMVTEGIKKGKN